MTTTLKIEKPYCVVKITVSMYRHHLVEEVVYYRNKISLEAMEKYSWYFGYLAALVKVANPQRKVVIYKGGDHSLPTEKYIEKKKTSLLRARKGQIKRLLRERGIEPDLFGFKAEDIDAKIERIQLSIEALERGETNFYVPPNYLNRIKKWKHRVV